MKKLILLLIPVVLAIGCSSSDDPSVLISGEVTDAFTGDPVANVKVSLLEDGPVTYTHADGIFQFEDQQVMGLPESDKIVRNGDSGAAVSLTHDDYRPREANVYYNARAGLTISPAAVPAYFYHEPVFLNDGIPTGELADAGLNRQTIQNLMDKLYSDDFKEIHSLLIYRHGMLVLEEYFFGNNDTIQFENNIAVDRSPPHVQWSRTDPHYVASVNKALTSTVVGVALDQFGVSTDARIADYLPEYTGYFEDPDKAAINFADCLTMTAGFQWDEWSSNDLALLWQSDDFAEFVLSRDNLSPGFEWRYNSALPNLMLKAVDNMVGGSVRDWANANFYHKLGITAHHWQSQPDGFPEGSARMFIRPRDMLKIGITYLNNGVWNGTQVVPESWVEECYQVKEQTASGDYSYHFWLRELDGVEYLSADGDGGNFINIFPTLDMVIVITQGNYLLWPFYVDQADEMMEGYIFEALE